MTSFSYPTDWSTRYRDRVATPAEAVARIRSGQRVFVGTGCAQPAALVKALVGRAAELADVELVELLTFGEAPYATRELAETFRVNTFFIGANVREVVQQGLGVYTPLCLSDIPRLFSSGQLPLDVALIHVTPPNDKGFCSLGISVDIVKSAAENARLVIAQVNPQMPWTCGHSTVHVDDLDVLVPVDEPLQYVASPPPDDVTVRIGEQVAALIEDGATVEFGIGRIPQAVALFLKEKRDLGVHTEMLTDTILDLIAAKAVTGRLKTRDSGKIVASLCVGSRRLYEAVHENPMFAFHPSEYVNDPVVIGQQYKQVAINMALEVDLTGQVCADSLGSQLYSGIGGHMDFNRGAARSAGGKAIIALPSTACGGKVSRIVCRLSPGAGVVTTRGDVHYVVTEYGVAYLHGKSVQERAIALISIAHPAFRESLLREAIEAKYVRPELSGVGNTLVVAPTPVRTTHVLPDGTPMVFRPIHPTDELRVRDLFYTLSQETIYYRFRAHLKRIPLQELLHYVYIDHRQQSAVVGVVPEAYGEQIIAIGRYYLDEKTNFAEVAFVVHDQWQGRGIGTALFHYLATIAKRNGIAGFTAEVLRDNKAMQRVFEKCSYNVTSVPKQETVSFRIAFT